MSDYILAYIPVGSIDEARSIARALVEEKVAACANIIPAIESFYVWEKVLHHEGEVLLLAKTKASFFDALVARVKALHSYQTPCIVALPIAAGDVDYLKWVDQSLLVD